MEYEHYLVPRLTTIRRFLRISILGKSIIHLPTRTTLEVMSIQKYGRHSKLCTLEIGLSE